MCAGGQLESGENRVQNDRLTVTLQIATPWSRSAVLARDLFEDAEALAAHGVRVDTPDAYRKKLRKFADLYQGDTPTERQQSNILSGDALDLGGLRFFSDVDTLAAPDHLYSDGAWFPRAGAYAGWLRALFPDASVRFLVATQDPAALLAAARDDDDGAGHPDLSGDGADARPEDLSWVGLVAALRAACPEVPVTVWRDEDMHAVWPQVVQAATGLGAEALRLPSAVKPLEAVMAAPGVERAQAFLDEHGETLAPEKTADVLHVFRKYYGVDTPPAPEIELPGWNAARAADVAAQYAADLDRIARMDGVTLLRA